VFRSLDRNGDGRLSKEELLFAYRQHNTEEQTQEIVENVMRKVDVDKSGFIDYSEFLAASINLQTLTSKANLEQAFRLFDKDGSGKITIQEVKEILGGDQQVSDSVWQQIMKEVDANSDGEIDLKEFINMMLQSIK
jgi:calcium-dependent protein kinase